IVAPIDVQNVSRNMRHECSQCVTDDHGVPNNTGREYGSWQDDGGRLQTEGFQRIAPVWEAYRHSLSPNREYALWEDSAPESNFVELTCGAMKKILCLMDEAHLSIVE
ncbi:hypothetical protein FRC09_009093, partial [Ceratobasidium sp. 395]